jgi:hypothetical protein
VVSVFGDPSDFAIEAAVEPDLPPGSAVWGRMRVRCGGAALGNIDERHCALYPAYCAFRDLVTIVDRLWAEVFEGLDDGAIFDMLDRLLYGGRFDSPVQPPSSLFGEEGKRAWAAWGCFDFLNNWGEQFDGYKSFLVCPPGGPVRVLSRSFIGHSGPSVAVSLDGVVAAATGFCNWFEAQETRLRENGATP